MKNDNEVLIISLVVSFMTLFLSNFQDSVTTGLLEDEVTTSTDVLTNGAAESTTSNTPEFCAGRPGRGYHQQRYLHFVRDAVYAAARALHNLHAQLCGPGNTGVCQAMKHIDGDVLRNYLANVTFNGELIT
jgi:Receptor family ligand binding region.